MSEKRRHSDPQRPAGSLRLLKTLRRLLGMARPYWWAMRFSIVLIFVGGLLQGAVPLFLWLVIFSINPTETGISKNLLPVAKYIIGTTERFNLDAIQTLFLFTCLLCFFYLLKSMAEGGHIYFSQLFAQRVIFGLRERLHTHLMRLSSSFFESRQTGDLMSRVSNDVSMLQSLVTSELIQAARAPITILTSLVVMLILSPTLTGFTLLVGPLLVFVITRASRKMRAVARDVQKRLGQLNAHLQERLSAVRVVQIFAREEHEIHRFDEINEKNVKANMRATKVAALLSPGVDLIAFFGMAIALLVAGSLMIKERMGVPDLMAYLVCAQQVGSGLVRLSKIRLAFDRALAAGERVFEILDTESEVQEPAQPLHLPRLQGQIEFDQVSFRYRTGEEVLNDINLRVSPGEVVALVGRSGAGKTSLVNLIPRFYDPTAGQIELDGTDIRGVSLSSLRSQIGIVPQETFLFADTIQENIAYGRLEATREEVIQAAKAANAHEFISNMDEGYDSAVGERGGMLSGGQRQRIAIARALLKDPRILILDEPTSSLDVKSEELVLEALARLMAGRTSLVIAHRPSTIKNADRILVLSNGRIAEEGNHRELIAAGGIYSHLYEGHFPSLPRAVEVTEQE